MTNRQSQTWVRMPEGSRIVQHTYPMSRDLIDLGRTKPGRSRVVRHQEVVGRDVLELGEQLARFPSPTAAVSCSGIAVRAFAVPPLPSQLARSAGRSGRLDRNRTGKSRSARSLCGELDPVHQRECAPCKKSRACPISRERTCSSLAARFLSGDLDPVVASAPHARLFQPGGFRLLHGPADPIVSSSVAMATKSSAILTNSAAMVVSVVRRARRRQMSAC